MKVTFLSHSGFLLETDRFALVFDYFRDPAGKLEEFLKADERPLYFLVSHFHGDHFNRDIAAMEERAAGYVLHSDCRLAVNHRKLLHYMEPGEEIETAHFRAHMYGSTDAGGSFHITSDEGDFFHAGDLNWWHWFSDTEEYNRHMKPWFFGELAKFTFSEVDIAFFPVDARIRYAREWGAKAFLERIRVKKAFIPMHAFGPKWVPTYEFRRRFPEVPLWIPDEGEEITL